MVQNHFKNTGSIKKLLNKTVLDMQNGIMDVKLGEAIIYSCSVAEQLNRVDELEQEIKDLRDRLKEQN